jgi:hypothetical protein
MTDKVYLAISGGDDDDRISGIFIDEALCDVFIERHKTSVNELQKKVFEVDPCAKYLADGLTHFDVYMDQEGAYLEVCKEEAIQEQAKVIRVLYGPRETKRLSVFCWARDEQHAREIALKAHAEVTEAGAWSTLGVFEPKETKND